MVEASRKEGVRQAVRQEEGRRKGKHGKEGVRQAVRQEEGRR